MDVVKIINLVHENKCLWDQSDARYHARDHQRNAWQKISEEMKIPVDELKKRWKVLRDTFSRELKKAIQQSGQAPEAELYSKWPHFQRLLFLQGTIRFYKDVADVSQSVDNSLDEEASNTDPQSPYSENNRSTFKREAREDSTEIERKLLRFEAFPTYDDDAQFLMSLWPFLKDVPKHRKLMVRSKLQQVLIDEQNESEINKATVKLEYSSD